MKNENGKMEQMTLFPFSPDSWCGKTCREPSHPQGAEISGPYSKKRAGSPTAPCLFLDLRPGGGNLLGPYWERDSPSLGASWTLNTGESPRDARESFLSQILEDTPLPKYYLSRKACLGILRRAAERGKGLPPQLKDALELQAVRPKTMPHASRLAAARVRLVFFMGCLLSFLKNTSRTAAGKNTPVKSGYFFIIQLFCKKYSPAFTKGKRVCYNTRGRAPNALPWAADLLPGYPYIRKGTEPYGKRKNRAHQCAGS